ncbi:MAG: hypothetical protein WCD18_12885 [Thermosynechococcaceae cyanobacterium]
MNPPAKLSPMTSYCIRRLVQTNQDQFLQQGIVLSEKELAEPEEILNKFGLGATDRVQRIQNLEILVRAYQSLSNSGKYPTELKTTEQQIFATLGLSNIDLGVILDLNSQALEITSSYIKKTIKASEAFEVIQSLLSTASKYLGPKIASEYLISTRPPNEVLLRFEMQENHKLTMNHNNDEILLESDLESIRSWIKDYIKKCSEIVNNFHDLVDKAKTKVIF